MKDSDRKVAARAWNEAHVNSARKGPPRNDNPDEIIPERGPRGKTAHHSPLPVNLSTDLSRVLTRLFDKSRHEDDWRYGIGTNLVEDSSRPHLVVDTGILVRAVGSNTFPECKRIVDLCIDGKIIPCVTEPIVHEYRLIIGLGSLENGVRFDQDSIKRLNLSLARCRILTGDPTSLPDQVKEDPSDDKFLVAQDLAFESTGRECSIVSRDGHLLNLPKALEKNIVRADDYLYLLKSGLLDSNPVY